VVGPTHGGCEANLTNTLSVITFVDVSAIHELVRREE